MQFCKLHPILASTRESPPILTRFGTSPSRTSLSSSSVTGHDSGAGCRPGGEVECLYYPGTRLCLKIVPRRASQPVSQSANHPVVRAIYPGESSHVKVNSACLRVKSLSTSLAFYYCCSSIEMFLLSIGHIHNNINVSSLDADKERS